MRHSIKEGISSSLKFLSATVLSLRPCPRARGLDAGQTRSRSPLRGDARHLTGSAYPSEDVDAAAAAIAQFGGKKRASWRAVGWVIVSSSKAPVARDLERRERTRGHQVAPDEGPPPEVSRSFLTPLAMKARTQR